MKHLSNAEIMTMRTSSLNARSYEFWDMMRAVCSEYGVAYSAVMAPTKGNITTCACRAMVCRIANDRGYSQAQIGRFLGRDHTSIMTAIQSTYAPAWPVAFKSVRGAV